jgi:hypothetical protein
MKVSILGPTNMKKFSKIMELPEEDIESKARVIGRILAKHDCEVYITFNYEGMAKLIGDAYKQNNGKLKMLFTKDESWIHTEKLLENLKEAEETIEYADWHEITAHIVSDSDVVICCGLSAGVFLELGYMKYNVQFEKGKIKSLICIPELIRDGKLPPELEVELDKILDVVPIADLDKFLEKMKKKVS